MFSFKNYFVPLFFLLILALPSCEKEDLARPDYSASQLSLAETYTAAQLVLVQALQDPAVRAYVKNRASDRMTYDYEIVYGMVKDEQLADGRSLEQAFLAAEAVLVGSKIDQPVVSTLPTTAPLLSINVPHGLFDWDTDAFIPPVILDAEENLVNGRVPAMYPDGHTEMVAVEELLNHAIITLEQNERMVFYNNAYRLDPGLFMAIAPKPGEATNGETTQCFFFGEEEICTKRTDFGAEGNDSFAKNNCPIGWNMSQFLTGIRMENIGRFETFGRPELRLRIFGGNSNIFTGSGPTGQLIVDPLFNPDRRSVNGRWWNTNHRLLFWYQLYGSILTYRWEEEDNPIFAGGGDTISFNIALEYNGQGYGANVTFPRGAGDDYIGTTIVDKDECGREYSVGAVQFRLQF